MEFIGPVAGDDARDHFDDLNLTSTRTGFVVHRRCERDPERERLMRMALDQIPGGPELCAWFGGVPIFSDAPLLEFGLSLDGPSRLTVKAWPFQPQGEYASRGARAVTFEMHGVALVDLIDLRPNSVLDDIHIESSPSGFSIQIEAAWGLDGRIDVDDLRISMAPLGEDPAAYGRTEISRPRRHRCRRTAPTPDGRPPRAERGRS